MNLDLAADLVFTALCLFREARGEAYQTKLGVAWVVRNRVERRKRPAMEIVTAPWQFSGLTAPGDPNLVKFPKRSDAAWRECLSVVDQVFGETPGKDPTLGSDHYLDISIPDEKLPTWADSSKFTVKLGRIKFYRLEG